MRTANAGTALLCGTVLLVAGCREPTGPGASPSHPQTTSAVSATPLDLGTLGGPNSYAADINGAGVVVGSSDVAGGIHAFRWTREGGMVDLGTIGGNFSSALEINDRGFILGLSRDGQNNLHIVIWTPDGGVLDLGRPPGEEDFSVSGFNNQNTVIGNLFGGEVYPHPYRWNRESGYSVVDPYRPGWETYFDAIDNDGTIAGTICCNGAPNYGWYLLHPTPPELLPIGAPTGFSGGATGMNDRHQIIGWDERNSLPVPYPDFWVGPFSWTRGKGFKYLGSLGGWLGYPADINNQGEIVGTSNTIPFDGEDPLVGFYYSERLGMVRLPGLDGGLTSAGGINRDGRIAGAAVTASGSWHAVVWNPPTRRLVAAVSERRIPLVAGGTFGECLTKREVYRTRTGVGHCLATGSAGVRPLH